MEAVVGIFRSRETAEKAVRDLESTGISKSRINLLAPGAPEEQIHALPTTEGEQPGMGKAVGGVVGGALGASAGLAASVFIPGVGPATAIGLYAAGLLGLGGAVAGASVGDALEESMTEGLPKDELFFYEDALRQGRTLVVVLAEDDDEAEAARRVFADAQAESIDAARERWWIGLRDAEAEKYTADGGDFRSDEPDFRRGFESALRPENRGRSYEETKNSLKELCPESYQKEPFVRGYRCGQDYHKKVIEKFR